MDAELGWFTFMSESLTLDLIENGGNQLQGIIKHTPISELSALLRVGKDKCKEAQDPLKVAGQILDL